MCAKNRFALFLHSGTQIMKILFLVPKPQLGNALAGEAPASRDGRRPQAGAWEREKRFSKSFFYAPY